jgi:PAS domain S-box-containing protein
LQKNTIIKLILVAGFYLLLANASEFLFEPTHTFFTIRLAPGFGLIAALIYGLPALCGIFLGEFLYFYFSHHSEITIPVSFALAANAVLYVYIGIMLIHRYVDLPNQLTNSLDYFKFFLLGGFAASLIPSLLAVYCISLIEPAAQQSFWLLGVHWWLGQALGVLIISPIILCFAWKSISVWQTRIPLIPVLMTMLLAVIVTIYVYVSLQEKEKLKSLLEQDSLTMSSAIQLQISNYEEALHSIKSLFEYTPDISPHEFEVFSNKIKNRQPNIHAMSYQQRVNADERHSYEKRMRKLYSDKFQITERDGSGNFKPASDREEYTPITMRSIYDKSSRIMGFDTSTSVHSRLARQQAKATNNVTISRAFSLVSTTDSSKSILLYLPLDNKGSFSGFVSLSVYVNKAIQSALENINMEGFSLTVWDGVSSENNIIYSKNTLLPESKSGLNNIGKIRFNSHDWLYELIPDSIYLEQLITSQLLAIIFCILLSSIVSVRLLEFTGKGHELSRRVSKSEERNRLLLDSTAEAIYGLDLNGNCTFCNTACLRMLGYGNKDDLLGENMHDLIHHARADGSPYPVEDCQIYKSFTNNERVHIDTEVLFRKDGSSFPAEYWSHPIIYGSKTVGSVVTFMDITERKRAEIMIQRSEENLRQLVEETNVLSWEADIKTFQFTYVSPQAEKITGFTPEQWCQPGFWSQHMFAEDRDWAMRYCQEFTEKQEDHVLDYRLVNADGDVIWIHDNVKIVFDEQDVPIKLRGIMIDITERKQADELLTYQASHDALTGLVNRREFERRAERLLATVKQDKSQHALCFMDLDQFKVVNDTSGHTAGDELLRQLGSVLKKTVRNRDTLARLGGDEFGVLMEHCHSNSVTERCRCSLLHGQGVGTKSYSYFSS